MTLSIISINLNNADGLQKTMKSVMAQSCQDFEYLVIDGGSTDGSVDVIKQYAHMPNLRWVSEKDSGLYNAMNKGIAMAKGEYLNFLNGGDILMGKDVVKDIMDSIEKYNHPELVIGKQYFQRGKKLVMTGGIAYGNSTLWGLYRGAYGHQASYIKRELFEKYGIYDESLKIASDWKWFIKVVAFENIKPVFVDIDVALFDMHGISSTNLELTYAERRIVLKEMLPEYVLTDYDNLVSDSILLERLRRHKNVYRLIKLTNKLLIRLEQKN